MRCGLVTFRPDGWRARGCLKVGQPNGRDVSAGKPKAEGKSAQPKQPRKARRHPNYCYIVLGVRVPQVTSQRSISPALGCSPLRSASATAGRGAGPAILTAAVYVCLGAIVDRTGGYSARSIAALIGVRNRACWSAAAYHHYDGPKLSPPAGTSTCAPLPALSTT